MSDPRARAWIVNTATAACRAVNDRLAGRRLGYHHWPARIANDAAALRCELVWTVRGGFNTGDAVVIRVADGGVSASFNDCRPIELGPLPVDAARVEAVLIDCAERAMSERRARLTQRAPAVGLVASEHGDIVAGMARGAIGRGGKT